MYFNKELIGKQVRVDEDVMKTMSIPDVFLSLEGMCVSSECDPYGLIMDRYGRMHRISYDRFQFVDPDPIKEKEISPMQDWINILTKYGIQFEVKRKDKDGLDRIIIDDGYNPEGAEHRWPTEVWFDEVGEFRCIGSWE